MDSDSARETDRPQSADRLFRWVVGGLLLANLGTTALLMRGTLPLLRLPAALQLGEARDRLVLGSGAGRDGGLLLHAGDSDDLLVRLRRDSGEVTLSCGHTPEDPVLRLVRSGAQIEIGFGADGRPQIVGYDAEGRQTIELR